MHHAIGILAAAQGFPNIQPGLGHNLRRIGPLAQRIAVEIVTAPSYKLGGNTHARRPLDHLSAKFGGRHIVIHRQHTAFWRRQCGQNLFGFAQARRCPNLQRRCRVDVGNVVPLGHQGFQLGVVFGLVA